MEKKGEINFSDIYPTQRPENSGYSNPAESR